MLNKIFSYPSFYHSENILLTIFENIRKKSFNFHNFNLFSISNLKFLISKIKAKVNVSNGENNFVS